MSEAATKKRFVSHAAADPSDSSDNVDTDEQQQMVRLPGKKKVVKVFCKKIVVKRDADGVLPPITKGKKTVSRTTVTTMIKVPLNKSKDEVRGSTAPTSGGNKSRRSTSSGASKKDSKNRRTSQPFTSHSSSSNLPSVATKTTASSSARNGAPADDSSMTPRRESKHPASFVPSPPSASSKAGSNPRRTSDESSLGRGRVSFRDEDAAAAAGGGGGGGGGSTKEPPKRRVASFVQEPDDQHKNSSKPPPSARRNTTMFGGAGAGAGAGDDDDHKFKAPVRRGSLAAFALAAAAVSHQHAVAEAFPKQPKCRPDDLDMPTKKMQEMLFDKYMVKGEGDAPDMFPISKLERALGKLWPGNELTSKTIDECAQVIVADRVAALANSDNAASSPAVVVASPAAFSSSSSSPAASTSDATLMDASSTNALFSATSATAATVVAASASGDLDPNQLIQREFFNLIKLISMYNNWLHFLPEDTHVADLSPDTYSIVGKYLQFTDAAKLFMELTGGMSKPLSLVRLCRHFALDKRKRASIASALLAAASFRAKAKLAKDKEESDKAAKEEAHNREVEELMSANFPRQPQCEPNDLTLPSSRIVKMLFYQEGQSAVELAGGGGGGESDENAALLEEVDIDEPPPKPLVRRGSNMGDLNRKPSTVQSSNALARRDSSSFGSPLGAGGGERFFPLAKLNMGLGKIWPGNSVMGDMVDDAVEVVLAERSTTEKGEKDGGGGGSSSSSSSLPENGVTLLELTRIFRTIANLTNIRPMLPLDPPIKTKLSIEQFAMVYDRLKFSADTHGKPARLFLSMSGGRGDFVSLPKLLFEFYVKKGKTIRGEKEREHDEEDPEEEL